VGAPLASWGTRVAATLLDTLFTIALLIVPTLAVALAVALALGLDAEDDTLWDVVWIPVYLLFLFLYYPLLMRRRGRRNGQTWGKQIMGIRVIREDGDEVTARTAIVREIAVKTLLFSTLSGCACGIPYLLDVLWPTWDDRNQALHDMMVHTLVVEAS
jgi:uncharacterized RDD family membrane protein YckC